MNAKIVARKDLHTVMDREWVDKSRRPFVRGEEAFVPVREGYPFDTCIPARRPYTGRGYQMIGPIAVIHGKKPTDEEIDRLVRWQDPQGVLWLKSFRGAERIPETEILAGMSGEVLHRENGICFWIDPSAVMFAQGNREEKARMQEMIGGGERVADMYAGIGYFSIPAALAGARVHAMEMNPVAFAYLERNIVENNLQSCIFPECGDCRDLLSGTYDRFIMGHFESHTLLATALGHAMAGSVLHVHSAGGAPPDISQEIKEAGFEADIRLRRVKKTGPGKWHYVQDVTLS